MSPNAKTAWERWLPFILTTMFQIVGSVAYAIHVSDQGVQNAKDIAEMKMVLVPRPEIEQQKQDTKEALHIIDSKLDILLTRGETK